MKLFKDRLFNAYFFAIMLMLFVVISQTVFAQAEPQPREPEFILQINPVAGVDAPVQTFEIDQLVLEDVLKLISHLPMFQWFFTWFTIIMAIIGILNYVAYLTPWPWDDAIMQPVAALFRRIAGVLKGWRRGY